jgi:hypothetical protein
MRQRAKREPSRLKVATLATLGGLMLAAIPQAAQAETLKLLTSWGENDRPSYIMR